MWYDNPYTIVAIATADISASSFCSTVVFFQRLLQARLGLRSSSKEEQLENAGARLLYRSYALPVIQTTV